MLGPLAHLIPLDTALLCSEPMEMLIHLNFTPPLNLNFRGYYAQSIVSFMIMGHVCQTISWFIEALG